MHLLYPNTCPVCGKIVPFNQEYCKCSDEQSQMIPLEACDLSDPYQCLNPFAAVWYYNGRVRYDLLRLKFMQKASLAKPLGLAMAERAVQAFPAVAFDCVTFVPMTTEDLRVRSFNQSALLAQWIARSFFIQCSALLKKVKSTPCQHSLNQSDRLNNLEHAFAVTELVKPDSTVLLVDDIKTTGTTLLRCCDTLLQAGVKEVYSLACAMSDYDSLSF